MEKPLVNDRNALFAQTETECHHLKVSPDSEEYLRVWVKEPTWLQVEQALSSVMKLDAKTQSLDLDMNEMYKFMVENFVEKTEPQLSGIGAQLKEILPNPFMDLMGADEGNE